MGTVKIGDVVAVEWCDAEGWGEGWTMREDIGKEPPTGASMFSFGVMLYEDDQQIAVGGHFGVDKLGEFEQTCGILTIPKCSVRACRRINLEGLSYDEKRNREGVGNGGDPPVPAVQTRDSVADRPML